MVGFMVVFTMEELEFALSFLGDWGWEAPMMLKLEQRRRSRIRSQLRLATGKSRSLVRSIASAIASASLSPYSEFQSGL